MKEITCKNCIHCINRVCLCRHIELPLKCDICQFFEGKEGKVPRFCKFAGSVDEMAKEMVFERRFQGEPPEWFFVKDENFNIGGSKHEAIAAAKAWLMEVEE